MNMRRLVVFLAAAVAAGGAVLLARGLLGGGTTKADARPTPAPIAISSVLVAASSLQPGQPLTGAQVRWQKWPTSSVDPGFIQQSAALTAEAAVAGTYARSPIAAGEPITYAKIVKSDAGGFMAATLQPGMRAVSIPVSIASVAGGFILPNNRVDVILTAISNDTPKRVNARIVLADVRVLAIDQSANDKGEKSVSDIKTATLELTPDQVRTLTRAEATGPLSLALRALGDYGAASNPAQVAGRSPGDSDTGDVSIIRYGVARSGGGGN
ncbi:MAG: Flp pilus assembly protein CpaB [Alphaproteobacteria bacterium]|nr:Flp pilus assembly protein CpaB [Alphaproteobacteria bacterium]